VPFAASDDAATGYRLSTFSEHPASKKLHLISSTVQAVDLYCDRNVLFGHTPPPEPGGAPCSPAAGLLLLLACCLPAARLTCCHA
jgi:hypothetical protein